MREAAVLELLLESALRSALLGLGAFLLLKLARVRDARAETAAWTVVLVASLAMPFLTRWLPGVFTVSVPRLPASLPVSLNDVPVAVPAAPARHANALSLAAVLWTAYSTVTLVGLARLALGLTLTQRIHSKARPVEAVWTCDLDVRVSDQVQGPMSFGRSIVLPRDFEQWPESKLQAVMAHEECHIRRGDFFIQLLAALHRAVFWFNPFAWWLQSRLGELAETASDEAAVRRLQDAPRYAEILLEVSRRARPVSPSAGIAALGMAHGPSVAKRLDHILTWRPARAPSFPVRAAGAGVLFAAALGLAQVHAAVAPTQRLLQPAGLATALSHPDPLSAAGAGTGGEPPKAAPDRSRPSRAKTAPRPAPAAPPTQPAPAPSAEPVVASAPAAAAAHDDVTYNPRALLDGPFVLPIASFALIHDGSEPSD